MIHNNLLKKFSAWKIRMFAAYLLCIMPINQKKCIRACHLVWFTELWLLLKLIIGFKALNSHVYGTTGFKGHWLGTRSMGIYWIFKSTCDSFIGSFVSFRFKSTCLYPPCLSFTIVNKSSTSKLVFVMIDTSRIFLILLF